MSQPTTMDIELQHIGSSSKRHRTERPPGDHQSSPELLPSSFTPATDHQRRLSQKDQTIECRHAYWCEAKRGYATDFCIFLLFIFVLTVYATQYRNGQQGYYLSSSIDDTIFAQEMPFDNSHIRKTFHEVEDMGELWSYYDSILTPALYPETCTRTNTSDCLPSVSNVNYVVSPPRVFQTRMDPVKCVVPGIKVLFFFQ